MNLPGNDQRVHDPAELIDREVATHLRDARFPIDLDFDDVTPVGVGERLGAVVGGLLKAGCQAFGVVPGPVCTLRDFDERPCRVRRSGAKDTQLAGTMSRCRISSATTAMISNVPRTTICR